MSERWYVENYCGHVCYNKETFMYLIVFFEYQWMNHIRLWLYKRIRSLLFLVFKWHLLTLRKMQLPPIILTSTLTVHFITFPELDYWLK